MKEVKFDYEGMPYTQIRPTCDTCKKEGWRMGTQAGGQLRICKDKWKVAYPFPCAQYSMNLKTKVSEFFKHI